MSTMLNQDLFALQQIMRECHRIATAKGWHEEERTFGDVVTLMHSELSEAYEEFRNGHDFEEIYAGPDGKPEGIAVELADCLIRIFDTCQHENIPLIRAMQLKMAYNETRPHKHGGKRT